MRAIGVLLLVLVFGHLFVNLMLGEGIHRIDFAFVAGKWTSPFWQVWDMLMLWLAELHGFNGVRTIINDYTEKDSTRWVLKGLLVASALLVMVLGTLVIFTFDPCIDAASTLSHVTSKDRQLMQTHKYDVVIVGAGGAGMRAALESSTRARTAVLTKLYPTRSHTGAAQGGMCAALANVEEDNWEWHTFDTVKGGDYLVDQDAAEIMCREAIDAVIDLEKMGLPFNRTPEGKIDQRRFGGHTRNHGEAAVRRSCFAADRTGHMILQTLYQNCVKQGVEFYNEFYVLDLLLNDAAPTACEHTAGVVAYELATGEIHVFQAKSVVFATGGTGKVFKTTSNAHTLTGDGMGVAFRRGIPLEDMEFFQFHPTGLAGPGHPAVGGGPRRGRHPAQLRRRALHGALRPHHQGPRPARHRRPLDGQRGARGPRRRPQQGLRPARPDPPRAGAHRRQAARHHRVRPHLPRRRALHRAGAGLPDRALRHGRRADQRRDRGAAQQHRRRAGPYAAGEVACVSVHGSNRLGTNSLLDINVFGRRAGIAAAEYRRRTPPGSSCPSAPSGCVVGMVESIRGRETGERVADLRRELQETMDRNVQVFRTEASMKEALGVHRRAQGALRQRRRPGQGQALQHRPARGRRARLPHRAGRGHHPRGPGPQGVPRRALPRGLRGP